MRTILMAALLGFASLSAQAGGTEISGGKTNSAILIYDHLLDLTSQQLILNEIGKQVALGKINGYGIVIDLQGVPARCVQFKLLDTFDASTDLISQIAVRAGTPEGVRVVGSCRLDTIN